MPPASLLDSPVGSTPVPSKFRQDLLQVADQLRSALSSLMTSVGLDPRDPQILNRHWDVNKTLSWKVSKIIQTDDAFLALQQLPGREGIDILLQKGRAAGAQPKYIQATKRAIDQFDDLIKVHCGNRETFDMMGSDLTTVGRQQRDEQHRKQLFYGASYVWGVQARLQLNIRFIAPNADRVSADVAKVAGFLDFRRLRENVSWELSNRRAHHDDGSPFLLLNSEPIDQASAELPVPLMLKFCSSPAPALNIIRDANSLRVDLAPGQPGNDGVISYITGVIDRHLPLLRTPRDQFVSQIASINTPAEMTIYDLYIHESLSYAIPPKVLLRSMIGNPPVRVSTEDWRLLPLFEPLVDIGTPDPPRVTEEIPRYSEMLDTVFTRTGWSPSQFRGFRIKMAFPPIPTALAMRYPLPEVL